MGTQRVLSIVLLVVGVALLVVGVTATDSVADRMSHAFTGKYTDGTMWYILGGIVCVAAGVAAMVGGKWMKRGA